MTRVLVEPLKFFFITNQLLARISTLAWVLSIRDG